MIADPASSLVEVVSRDRKLQVSTLFSQHLVSGKRLRQLKAMWFRDGPKLSSMQGISVYRWICVTVCPLRDTVTVEGLKAHVGHVCMRCDCVPGV